jgi:uncharacterized protein YutE (UPF0331/DUF86 family)
MNALPIEKDIILKRFNGIQGELAELSELAKTPFQEFKGGVGFKLAQYHLHRALEGVFHISSHILSRIPGAQATEYKELARKLGEFGVVDNDFANTKLVSMARYRNRLVHFYAEVTAEELYEILQKDLKDFDIFLQAVKNVLADPKRFGIAVV